MPNSPCGLRLKVSLPPMLVQFTDAGLAILVIGLGVVSDGVHALRAKTTAQIEICTHPLVNSHKTLPQYLR